MAKNQITKEQVNHVAELSKIPLHEGEAEKFAEMFTDTLKTVEVLNELDTSKTLETYQVTGLVNVYQKGDENEQTLSQEDSLKNAKETKKGLFVTKGVFDRS